MNHLLVCLSLVALLSCKKEDAATTPTAQKTADDVVLTSKSLDVPLSNYDIGNYSFQSIMVGNSIYYASYSNTAKPQFFTRYDIASNTFSAALAKSSNVCGCGYSSRLITDGTNVFYIANDATKYVASSNTWSPISYPATAKDNAGEAGVGYYGGNIYFVGGRTPSTLFKYYSISQDKWFTLPNYLYPTNRSQVVAHKDKLYVLGGSGAARKVSSFSTGTNTWTALADAPFDINSSYESSYSVTLNDYIFLLQSQLVHVYDIAKDSWSTTPIKMTDLPSQANLFTNGQKLYVAGKNHSNIPVAYELVMSYK